MGRVSRLKGTRYFHKDHLGSIAVLTDDGMRVIQPADKLAEGEKPEDWWVIVDNLQRARLNYPMDPQKPAGAPPEKSGP